MFLIGNEHRNRPSNPLDAPSKQQMAVCGTACDMRGVRLGLVVFQRRGRGVCHRHVDQRLLGPVGPGPPLAIVHDRYLRGRHIQRPGAGISTGIGLLFGAPP